MKKLSVITMGLAVLLVVGSGFIAPNFSGYRLFLISSYEQQPMLYFWETPHWYDQNLDADEQQSYEYDLDEKLDPTPSPGDELCVFGSSIICAAQIRITYDQVDWSYGVDYRVGSYVD